MKKLFIIGFAALLLVAFTAPAMAKVKIGGIIFTDAYYLDRSKRNDSRTTDPDKQHAFSATKIQVPDITRLNGRWTNEDNVGMFIELGLGQTGGSTSGGNGAMLRHAYGWWDVTPAFQLMAGHTTTPFSQLNPSQLLGTRSGSLNIIGLGYGEFYSGRFPQIRGTFRFGKVARLEIALVDPNQAGNPNVPPAPKYPGVTPNAKLPRFDLGLPLHFGPLRLYPSAYFNYKSLDGVKAGWDDDLYAWGASLGLRFGAGPFSLSAEGQVGRNWRNSLGSAGISPAALAGAASINTKTGSIQDSKCYGAWIDLAFKLGPATPHLIYGYANGQGSGTDKTNATSQMIGVSMPISLAKGFSLRPEVMFYFDGTNNKTSTGAGINNGSYGIYGLQLQITF